MKQTKLIALLAVLAVGSSGGLAQAQLTGGSFAVPVGGPVGGGGNSAGASFAVVGSVPLSGAGTATGASFIVNGGIIAAVGAGIAATYAGGAVELIPFADRPLRVVVLGGTGPASGTLHYRLGGAVSYRTAAMTNVSDDTLEIFVRTNLLGPRGLEYYFSVARGVASGSVGGPGTPYAFVVAMNNAQGQRPGTLPDATGLADYRMVSVPIDLTGSNAVNDVFRDDLGAPDKIQWRLFSYDVATDAVVEFPSAAPVEPRRAYWLIARGGLTYGAAGESRRPNRPGILGNDYWEQPLDSGWNLLANPYAFGVAWGEALFEDADSIWTGGPDATVVENRAYWWSGTRFDSVGTIPAWGGAFVKATKPGVSALFRYHEAGAVLAPTTGGGLQAEAAADGWSVHLALEAGEFADVGNYLGVRTGAVAGADRFDFSEPPAAPVGVRLAFRLPEGDQSLKRTDYRPPFTEGATWDVVLPQATDRRLTVTGLDQIPAGMSAKLILDVGSAVDLSEGAVVDLPNDTRAAHLAIGNPDYTVGAESAVVPSDYALHQNFPNPFNPETRIRFALPAGTQLRVTVFNMLGQRVRLLADGTYAAGTHDLLWDGRDDQGRSVGSGVFFYRFDSDVFTETRKMLLMK